MISLKSEKLKVAMETFGCQMNEYDSQVAAGLLEAAGFEIVNSNVGANPCVRPDGNGQTHGSAPTSEMTHVDVFIMNTCSVREHAEDKVYSRLGALGKTKKENPDLIVGLMGCMVEEHQEKLFKRFPQLDLMVGTRNLKELPSLIEEVRKNHRQVAKIKQDGISIEYTDLIKREGEYHAWLPIMTGCDKVCTYCIVPITRGSEVSMPAREVYREASRLVSEGVQWITLLGQNVNSYRGGVGAHLRVRPDEVFRQTHRSAPTFPQLLEMLCEIEGLKRISFTTSHPSDATEELYRVIAKNPKISRRFHLPLQSGSDRMLKRMKRLHTYEEYKSKINLMRKMIPDISVTTDMITGFSGETDEDHRKTLAALRELQFDSAYIYKYSVRPQTPAAKLDDDVPREAKEARHAEILTLQRQITKAQSDKWIGKTVTVFAEEKSTRALGHLIGRTDQDRKVVFEASESLLKTFTRVILKNLRYETFVGELCRT